MKENELRIDNFVYHTESYENKEKKIIQFTESNWYRIGDCLERIEDFEPIPLTEEWLLKFGFKDLGYGEFEKGVFLADGEYTDKYEYEFCHLGKRLCTINYVHQLQNLYFALKGEELTA